MSTVVITSQDFSKMEAYHERKKDDTMYHIDDYYYASLCIAHRQINEPIFKNVSLSGNSIIVVKRKKIGGNIFLREFSLDDVDQIKKFVRGYLHIQ